MGRPQSADGGRPVIVSVRLSAEEVRDLDRRRRSLSRSAYLRALLRPDALIVDARRGPVVTSDENWPY